MHCPTSKKLTSIAGMSTRIEANTFWPSGGLKGIFLLEDGVGVPMAAEDGIVGFPVANLIKMGLTPKAF